MIKKAQELMKEDEEEKQFIKGMGFCAAGTGSDPAVIDVKDGKIVRIRPLHYDWKYNPERFRPWKVAARGKFFEPKMKILLTPHGLAYKKRIYSPNRILYPMKRVDWDPNGERNPQNRGKSGYVRISWDEALDIIVSEIQRVREKYGPYGILLQGDGHGEQKIVHGPHGCHCLLFSKMGSGEFTLQARNADSWEGWFWGSKHVWGMELLGLEMPLTNIFPDVAENTDMILYWGCDPETTPWGWQGQTASRLCYWLTELGIKSTYICPDLNYGAAVHADKWIPIRPNTDAALQLAIAYLWFIQGTYDKEYVATHTVGADKFAEYVLGKEDGIPKTPKWAAEITGVPSRIIKRLAREWASKTTSTAHGAGGSYIRGPYSSEPARLEVLLLAMQGVGKPGVHQVQFMNWGIFYDLERMPLPRSVTNVNLWPAHRGHVSKRSVSKQFIPKLFVHEAILNPPVSWYSTTMWSAKTADQFKKYTYPAEGCSKIHMIWSDNPCLITCWNNGNAYIEAYRSPKIESFVAQHPWLENDCLFADIILPVSTKFEEEDIGSDSVTGQFNSIWLEGQCIKPLGESKSDYEIVCMVAERLGYLEEFTEGRSIQDWIRYGFENSGVADMISWEEFKEKGYWVAPTDPEWEKYPRGCIDFYNDPENNPLTTPTGKIEFESTGLLKHFPDDEERPPVPKWIEGGPGWSHDERLSSERAKNYPLLIVSNHPKWRVHANLDDVSWFHEIPTCKVRGPDGYLYEPIWINPKDAEKRGIENGDVVKIFNERGGVLVGAYVTERIMPGVVYVDHGARYDPIVLGELDRGGAINSIAPRNPLSKNAGGMATSGFLVEVERVDLGELMKKYPEAFKRLYHPTAGLCVERVLGR